MSYLYTGQFQFMVDQAMLKGAVNGHAPMDIVPYQLYLQQQAQLDQMQQMSAMQQEQMIQQQNNNIQPHHPYVCGVDDFFGPCS